MSTPKESNHPHFVWKDLFKKNKNENTSVEEVLRQNILFKTLTSREVRYLATRVYERIYQADEPVFQQNDRGLGMYMIARGRVAIKTQGLDQTEVLVTVLSEGSFFGELALVDNENIRSASAVALERTVLIGFFKPDLQEIIDRRPDVGVKILFNLSTILGRRLLETTEKITLLSRKKSLASHGSRHDSGAET